MGYVERFNPALRELRRRMVAGEFGQIRQVRTLRQGAFSSRTSGVGVINDLATHDLDATQWLAGSRYRELRAQVLHVDGHAHEDLATIMGRLENGVVTSHNVDRISPVRRRLIEVSGARGLAVADTVSPSLVLHLAAGAKHAALVREADTTVTTDVPLPDTEPLVLELAALRDAVTGGSGAGDIVTLAEGLHAVATTEWVLAELRQCAVGGEAIR